MKKRSNRIGRAVSISTLALGATLICLATTQATAAIAPTEDTISILSQIEEGYEATIYIANSKGTESLAVPSSKTTVRSALEDRGYDADSLLVENGESIPVGHRLANGESYMVYENGIEGSSEEISIPAPTVRKDDASLYVGQEVASKKGSDGKAIKTAVVYYGVEDNPAKGSTALATSEENYYTVTLAPVAHELRVGTKVCTVDYICEMLEAMEKSAFEFGDYGHPLGAFHDWTTYSGSESHDGGAVDFPLASGTPIYAVADGVVEGAGWMGSGGNMALIKHKDGYTTGYAHMVELPVVKTGDTVKKGQLIGHVGSTGRSTGPHLHFQVQLDGERIPTYDYMALHGVEIGDCVDGPCELAQKEA